MKKKIILLIAFVLLIPILSFSQELSSPEGLAVLKELSEKYHGSQIVELQNGVTLKADAITMANGFLLIAFKGNTKDENKYENAIWIPLNEVKSINREPIDQFLANSALCFYYIIDEANVQKADIYFQNSKNIFENEGSPEKYKKAIEILSANLEKLKKNGSLDPMDKATALMGFGRYDEALSLFKQTIALQPNNATAHMNYGNALFASASKYFDRNRKPMFEKEAIPILEESIIHFKKAIDLFGNDKTSIFWKSHAYYLLGDIYHYGLIDLNEAKNMYQKSLSLNPDYEIVQEELKRIEEKK